MRSGDYGSTAESASAAGEQDEACDLRTRETKASEPRDVGGQGSLHTGAEELRVLGDDRGDIGAGEAEAGEEGEDCVEIGW